MAFSIRLLPEPTPEHESDEKVSWGEITIGPFRERFLSPLSYWSAADYERHWRQAAARIVQSPAPSCLITSMRDPAMANFIFWWVMYRAGDTVLVQNQILFLDNLSPPFDPDDPFSSISERRTVSEDGEEISEWSIPIKDVESFLIEEPSKG